MPPWWYAVYVIRTQIQIDEKTHEKLRLKAFAERKSLSRVIREILSSALDGPASKRRRHFSFIGIVTGKVGDVSERHDEYLGSDPRW